MERKLATIRTVAEVKPITKADLIEAVRVDGWWVVCKKDEFKVGDTVVYLEIDSWVPHDLAPFLTREGSEPREYLGIKGQRLRTIKLRGQMSQGLILPISLETATCEVGDDVTEALKIIKWEPPFHMFEGGKGNNLERRGNFPISWRKTDQERIQNLTQELQEHYDAETRFEVTMKLDGSSMSIGKDDEGEFNVCSRNINIKLDVEGNKFVRMARELDIDYRLGGNIQICGELMGEGIQGNRENIQGHKFFVYDIFYVELQRHFPTYIRGMVLEKLGLKDHVPVLYNNVTLKELGLDTVDKVLAFAEGPSLNHRQREGVVFKSMDGSFSFKAISNKFLLGEK